MLLDCIVSLNAAKDVPTLRRLVSDYGRSLGFKGFCVITPIAQRRDQGRILSSIGFDAAWARAYTSSLRIADPLPDIVIAGSTPYRWGKARTLPNLTAAERGYLDSLDQFGMSDGLMFPVFGTGARTGVMGFGLHPDLDSLDTRTLLELHNVIQTGYMNYCQLMIREVAPDQVLSAREREVLYWITRGKSNNAMATILDISASTVDTYIRRIFAKLGVSDRVGAAMAAVQQGYVIAGAFRQVPEPDPLDLAVL